MCSFIDRIVIDKNVNIGDLPFEILSREIESNNFFLYLTKFNKDLLVDYCKEEDGTILLFIKNITDESDGEISLVRFKYTFTFENGHYILEALPDKDYENDDFFVIDFESFTINMSRLDFNFTMSYNSKKYPKCVIVMIKKYFETIFSNFESFTNSQN